VTVHPSASARPDGWVYGGPVVAVVAVDEITNRLSECPHARIEKGTLTLNFRGLIPASL
jgi:hypothetical protein